MEPMFSSSIFFIVIIILARETCRYFLLYFLIIKNFYNKAPKRATKNNDYHKRTGKEQKSHFIDTIIVLFRITVRNELTQINYSVSCT